MKALYILAVLLPAAALADSGSRRKFSVDILEDKMVLKLSVNNSLPGRLHLSGRRPAAASRLQVLGVRGGRPHRSLQVGICEYVFLKEYY